MAMGRLEQVSVDASRVRISFKKVRRSQLTSLIVTRKVGNTRLVRANTDSPYGAGLAEVLTRAFGVPVVPA